jgi:hypothetical protein
MDVCVLCLYVVLSCVGRGPCDRLITRPGVLPCVLYLCDHRNPEKGALCSKLGTKGK